MHKTLVGFIAASALIAGCSTTDGTSKITPSRVAAISRLAAYTSTVATLQVQPEARASLVLARGVLDSLIAQGEWDVAHIAEVIQQHAIDKLIGSEGSVIVTTGILLTDAWFGTSFDLRDNATVEAVVTGIRDGLTLALGGGVRGMPTYEPSAQPMLEAAAKATR